MADRSPRVTAGIAQALLAAVLFGISTPIAKGLLSGTSPQLLAGLLYLGSGAGLGILWSVHVRAESVAKRRSYGVISVGSPERCCSGACPRCSGS